LLAVPAPERPFLRRDLDRGHRAFGNGRGAHQLVRGFRDGTARFCRHCGSALFWKEHGSDSTSILAGAFDQPSRLKLAYHIYCADKADYYEITDGLPQYAGTR
jgi:hypothetical protein